jgi:hypothetical protein
MGRAKTLQRPKVADRSSGDFVEELVWLPLMVVP